jgi:hypothetical protein
LLPRTLQVVPRAELVLLQLVAPPPRLLPRALELAQLQWQQPLQ